MSNLGCHYIQIIFNRCAKFGALIIKGAILPNIFLSSCTITGGNPYLSQDEYVMSLYQKNLSKDTSNLCAKFHACIINTTILHISLYV